MMKVTLFTLLLLSLIGASVACSSEQKGGAQTSGAVQEPNVIFILADDMRASDLSLMPKTKEALGSHGVTFDNSFVTDPLCCPSRATFLTGLYAHNHGIKVNYPPEGGAEGFQSHGLDEDTLATRMQAAGYKTAYFGKYLNAYDSLYVPPGWDEWRGFMGSYNQAREGHDPRYYRVNENGTMQVYSRRHLDNTDYLSQRANEFVTESGPFFLVVATNAPHEPAYVAKRYRGEQRSVALPKPPSFDEADVLDKPHYVRAAPRLSEENERELRRLYRRRAGSLKAVDDLVASLVKTLGQTGGLDNTYIVFTSDNGYLLGEHRLDKKQLPYEEAIRVPLVVRGPGVEQGQTRTELVANVDWAPSVLDWASGNASGMDGRSLAPLLSDTPIQSWRKRLLVESFPTRKGPPAFRALRTSGEIYVEYGGGFREFYDLTMDPYQLENSYPSAGPALISRLSTRLATLKDCSGDTCREAEGP